MVDSAQRLFSNEQNDCAYFKVPCVSLFIESVLLWTTKIQGKFLAWNSIDCCFYFDEISNLSNNNDWLCLNEDCSVEYK